MEGAALAVEDLRVPPQEQGAALGVATFRVPEVMYQMAQEVRLAEQVEGAALVPVRRRTVGPQLEQQLRESARTISSSCPDRDRPLLQ